MEGRRNGMDVTVRMATLAQSVHVRTSGKLGIQHQGAAMSTASSGINGRRSGQVTQIVAKVLGVAKRRMVKCDTAFTGGTGHSSQRANAQIKSKRGSLRGRPE